MLTEKDLAYIAKTCQVQMHQTHNVIQMLAEGMTVPFISRYRKEKTNNLDELGVNKINENYEYVKELNDRKETVLKTIDSQGKLTDELKKKIEETYSKTELEDIYLPYKPKRRTKATIAKEKGLEPLALSILDETVPDAVEVLAEPYISEEKKVNSIEEALEGAGHIIAEQFSENAALRKKIRKEITETGTLSVSVTKDWEKERSKFEQYYDYNEAVKSMPSHRILAIRRGETEKVLKVRINSDKNHLQQKFKSMLFKDTHPRYDFLDKVLEDALTRLLLPSIEQDIHMEMKKQADEEAINVFASNLETLLLSPPAGNLRVMGVDPGYRTGCKLVVLDETGKLLATSTIYPTKPLEKIEAATQVVKELIDKYQVESVAIGNGTASRETRAFFKNIVPDNVIVSVISEAGASVYSASGLGREEFPDQDVTVRGAVSIGRRFQDPLAELVKIDPKSIGVGQYQHDVNQTRLKSKLDQVVSSVVNRVGVELNTASYHLLKYVSGIGATLAKNIVQFRNENGMFKNREELNHVRMFGAKAFQQSAGFLRIRSGENPLDSTGIHPESYFIVQHMCKNSDVPITQLIRNKPLISQFKPEEYITDDFGIPTIQDILKELETPGRDPRKDFEVFEFEEGVETLEDLEEGMKLKGVVTNVTRFGAFVDIGVHQDGLVHISELSHQYVTHPDQVISVGDKVKVKVLKVDHQLKRIQLSIKALQDPPQNRKKNKRNKYRKKEPPPQKKNPTEDLIDSLKAKWGAK
ncbi:MAG: RNA-binding transcriptional accessory protein [Candidatus Aminicenantes bacterium]|nr:MAG: RNA-binding transcriptional accessory protein [Candidatus Aminicenantes bacterium]